MSSRKSKIQELRAKDINRTPTRPIKAIPSTIPRPENTPADGLEIVKSRYEDPKLKNFINMLPFIEEIARALTGDELEAIDSCGDRVHASERFVQKTAFKRAPYVKTLKLDFDGVPLLLNFARFGDDDCKLDEKDFDPISYIAGKLERAYFRDIDDLIFEAESIWHTIDSLIDRIDSLDTQDLFNLGRALSRKKGAEQFLMASIKNMHNLKLREEAEPTKNLNLLVKRSMALAGPLLREEKSKGKTMIHNIGVENDHYVNVKSLEFQMALSMIIHNAIKHGTPDHGTVTINFDCAENGEFVDLFAGNNGIPISDHVLPILFNEPLMVFDGTGYGLYAAGQIIRSFGGAVDVASDKRNTIFRLKLPKTERIR